MEKYPGLDAKVRQDTDIISTFVNFFFPYEACVSTFCDVFDISIVMYL